MPQVLAENDLDENDCWHAVLQRDASHDGRFIYGVTTTRIFCRPTCPSRRPRRENARFFATSKEAERAGFRACKRCRPADKPLAHQRVQRACRIIEANGETPLSLSELSARVGGNAQHLQRTFKQQIGVSPREYAQSLRLQRFKSELRNGANVLHAQNAAGFASARTAYDLTSAQLGMTPATYGRGGVGASMVFGIAPCELGFVLVAKTARGVCSIALGDSCESLESALRDEFPNAQIAHDDTQLQTESALILGHLAGDHARLDLPLDVRATAWQWRVWQALRDIPRGETASYAQVAQQLEAPTAARAVARACATNPVALLIPCHRVVRGDGNLSGYRWGIARKAELLKREGETM